MRCAIIIFGVLLSAPVGLFWDVFARQTLAFENLPVSSGIPRVVEEFRVLCQEHQLALLHFHQERDAADRNGQEPSITQTNPAEEYFLRFLALAEKHAGNNFCHTILAYAVSHCHGPHVTPECHQRIQAVLEECPSEP
jgi:hypothetical protein